MENPQASQPTADDHSHLLRCQTWLNKCGRFMDVFVRTARHPLVLLFWLMEIIILVFMLGIPYWKYRAHQRQQPAFALPLTGQTRSNAGFGTIKQNWEAYSLITAGTLPVMFPSLSISNLPACSAANFVATTALLCGIISLATCEIYKSHFKIVREEDLAEYRGEVPGESWFKSRHRKFWCFISLPTVWFVFWFALLFTSIILSLWERITGDDTESCRAEKLHTFKYITLATLLIALFHFTFVFSMLHVVGHRT
ncbi:hypothetical protein P691DRAFT_808775 [Macrolepiota fuliginosa MF-IS2]|uniref:Uncharacterized protein n=1 Tax=Macrolepiota fuliginosa MF-IS2 TaxID=1400762 RepID=A0A9P5XKA6_9AGAR|nr:hypothetical protein P691DRAFT_808775 [Macrolepiota fuliginosa MF-IS2]